MDDSGEVEDGLTAGAPDHGAGSRPFDHSAEHAILGLLVLTGGAAHGYELARSFRRGQPLGEIIRLEPAMLYKHLKKLTRLGWLTMTAEAHDRRPPRHVCHLTPAGAAELRRWLAAPVTRTREIRLAFLVKLYFAWRLDPPLARRLTAEQRAITLRLAQSLASQQAAATATVDPTFADASAETTFPGDAAFLQLVLELRREQTLAAAAWLAQVAAAFEPAVDEEARPA